MLYQAFNFILEEKGNLYALVSTNRFVGKTSTSFYDYEWTQTWALR